MFARITCWTLLLLWCTGAHAAAVTATYTPVAGPVWSVDLKVENDGALPRIGGFTVYFDEASFGALSLQASPAAWDSLVVQPDPAIPDAGFLDAFAIDAADELAAGQSIGHWTLQFEYLGSSLPGALSFDIVDREFNVLFSGSSSVVLPVAVGEPGSLALLAAGGLAGAAFRRGRRSLR
jgi:hypothetical protein